MDHRQIIAAAIGIAALLASPALAQVPAANPSQASDGDAKLKPGANSFAEGQARELLRQNGYSNISPLTNDKDGIWHGKAIKNLNTFDVSIDYQGHIAAK